MVSEYTYEEYLTVWQDFFGDSETGDYGYYTGNQRMSCTVCRLSAEEFEEHLQSLAGASADFDAAYEAGDAEGVDKALKSAFPHELILLL